MSKRADLAYIRFDPCAGDRDVDIKCQEVRMVITRTPHVCSLSLGDSQSHEIKPGSRARFEKAIVDGDWHSYWCCLPCIDKEIEKWG